MTKVDELLKLGRSMAGHYSRPNKFITWYCDKRGYRGAWLSAPWCAMFASYLANKAGLGKDFGEFASCPKWVEWFKRNKRWSKTPKVGAVVLYDWDGDGVADHVGIVSKVMTHQIKAIEGNTRVGAAGNWVHEQTRNKSTVLGYGYPKYLDAPKGDDKPDKVHVVAKGDTLSKLAKTYKTTWQKIYAANKAVIGDDPALIRPGMKLVIP